MPVKIKRTYAIDEPKVRKVSSTSTTTTTPPTSSIGTDIGRGIGALLPKNLKKRKTQGLDYE